MKGGGHTEKYRNRNTILFALIFSCSLFLPYRALMLLRSLRGLPRPLWDTAGEDSFWLFYDVASFALLIGVLILFLRYRRLEKSILLLWIILLCAVSVDRYFFFPHIAFCIHLFHHGRKYPGKHGQPGLARSAVMMLQGLFVLVAALRLWVVGPGSSAFDTAVPVLHFALEFIPWLACLVFVAVSILRRDLPSLRLASALYAVGCLLDAFLLKSPIILMSPQFILALYLVFTWNRDIGFKGR